VQTFIHTRPVHKQEEELQAEEELLNHERHIIMENLEEMKKIRAQLEVQHRNVSAFVDSMGWLRSVGSIKL